MTKFTVLHLLDDTTPGGVTRVVDHIIGSRQLAQQAQHVTQHIRKGRLSMPKLRADMIVSHLSVSWRGLPALIALRAKHPNVPLIHVEHSYTRKFTSLNVENRERFFSLLRTAYALFDQVIAVSRAQCSWLVTRGLVNPERTRVIRSAVDLSSFEALPAPSGPPKVFGAIGRLHLQKGFDVIIPAFTQCNYPDLQLKIFGEGPERARLEKLAEADPRISLVGFCSDPVSAMQGIDALLVPSRWEAFGLVAQEALAAQRVCLISLVDGLQDQIADGAIPVAGSSISDWTQAITQAATFVPDRRTNLRKTSATLCFESNWSKLIDDCRMASLKEAA